MKHLLMLVAICLSLVSPKNSYAKGGCYVQLVSQRGATVNIIVHTGDPNVTGLLSWSFGGGTQEFHDGDKTTLNLGESLDPEIPSSPQYIALTVDGKNCDGLTIHICQWEVGGCPDSETPENPIVNDWGSVGMIYPWFYHQTYVDIPGAIVTIKSSSGGAYLEISNVDFSSLYDDEHLRIWDDFGNVGAICAHPGEVTKTSRFSAC